MEALRHRSRRSGPRGPQGRLLALALLCGGWASLGGLAGCSVSPPPQRPGAFPGLEEGVHPFTATCTPPVPCPGRSCADHALGPPDGETVELGACDTLDLFFSGGTIRTIDSDKELPDDPDLAIHLGVLGGISRVEASSDGLSYSVVGYLTGDPSLLPTRVQGEVASDNCLCTITGDQAHVYFNRCNTITNVSFVRIIGMREVGSREVSGSATIDAVEALTFCPWNDKECGSSR